MNRSGILVTSISKKVPMLRAVRAAGEKLGGPLRIVGADINPNCIGSHFVDQFWHMPPQSTLTEAALIRFCDENDIRFIIPSRDGELEFLSSARERLTSEGIDVMISSEDAIRCCRDKLLFSERLRLLQFPAIPSFPRAEEVASRRLVVKERFGAGALGLQIDVDHESARGFGAKLSHAVFQEYIEGTEFSVDVYLDRSGTCKGAISRRRDLVVGGESQVTTTQRHPQAELMCGSIAEAIGIYGHAVFQIIEDPAGALHVIECNARFGGASTLSIAAGLDSFYWFLLESCDESLQSHPFTRASSEQRQIRYVCDLVVEQP